MTLQQRLQERARQRRMKPHEDKPPRIKRDAWVMPAFEQRRLWAIGVIVGLPLLIIVLTGIAQRVQDSTILLVLFVVIALSWRVIPTIAGLLIWRCPKCRRRLPFNRKLNPFVEDHERCPYCGVMLK